jgi:O-acetyl-ADP-ribose deacetylase (regulator of RNase III)
VKGDATQPAGTHPRFIIHVCNNIGLWGAGFVMAVSRRWPAPEFCYYDWGGPYELGTTQSVKVEENLYVINMIGQSGVGTKSGKPPIRYEAIRKCLKQVEQMAKDPFFRGPFKACSIHAPKFGAGLAGGDWPVIEQLIQEELVDKGLNVTIYEWDG